MAEEGLEIDRRFRGGKIDVKKFAPRRLRPRLCSVFVLLHSILFMPSFKDARDLLLLSFDKGIIDEDEFLILYDLNTSGNSLYPYEDYGSFHLEDKDNVECKTEFRFEKRDIPLLAEALHIPESFKCHQGTVCDGIEGL